MFQTSEFQPECKAVTRANGVQTHWDQLFNSARTEEKWGRGRACSREKNRQVENGLYCKKNGLEVES